MRFGLLVVFTVLSVMLAMFFGAANTQWQQVASCLLTECDNPFTETILWQIRVPRVLVGFVAGAGLACAGAILQNTTRNPLADPYLFGIIAGAALGATIASLMPQLVSDMALPLAAFLGSLFSIAIVLGLAKSLPRADLLLLAGVAVSFMLSSLSQFILFIGEPYATNRVMFWLMGSLARVEQHHFYIITPVVITAIVLVLGFSRQIDALLLSDEAAKSLGINVDRLRIVMMCLCAALTATIVSYCGGIGFVGLMIPHIVRHWFGVTTVKLILASALVGGSFLVWVDVFARSAFDDLEIPIGIITSAIGSVFFIAILYRGRGLSR